MKRSVSIGSQNVTFAYIRQPLSFCPSSPSPISVGKLLKKRKKKITLVTCSRPWTLPSWPSPRHPRHPFESCTPHVDVSQLVTPQPRTRRHKSSFIFFTPILRKGRWSGNPGKNSSWDHYGYDDLRASQVVRGGGGKLSSTKGGEKTLRKKWTTTGKRKGKTEWRWRRVGVNGERRNRRPEVPGHVSSTWRKKRQTSARGPLEYFGPLRLTAPRRLLRVYA